ncbi:MAG: type II secretion system major pseudopilin GspG [Planctomycetes bacterium]|nr:type II secretion system major pseudopilin GspG [Planctomycetota bacterium]
MNNKNNRGFTLIELMMVVIIIGILAAIVVPKFTGQTEKARRAAAKMEIRNISMALDRYEMENGAFPTTEQGLKALMEKPTSSPMPRDWSGPYLKDEPKDPWQKPYQYRRPSQNGLDYDLWSWGPDERDGTADDIPNWKKDN